jgi:hypothetical protein
MIIRAALATASSPDRQQRAHPRYVAIVLARLVGAAQDHLVDHNGIKPRISLQQLFEH